MDGSFVTHGDCSLCTSVVYTRLCCLKSANVWLFFIYWCGFRESWCSVRYGRAVYTVVSWENRNVSLRACGASAGQNSSIWVVGLFQLMVYVFYFWCCCFWHWGKNRVILIIWSTTYYCSLSSHFCVGEPFRLFGVRRQWSMAEAWATMGTVAR